MKKEKKILTEKEKQKAKKGIRIFFDTFIQYKKQVIFLIILNVAVGFGDSIVPIVSGKLFDGIIKNTLKIEFFGVSLYLWLFYLILWMIIQLIFRTLDYVRNRSQTIFLMKSTSDYLLDGNRKLYYLPLPFHKNNKIGNTINKINIAAQKLYGAFDFIFELLPQFLSIILGFIFTFFIRWEFGLMLLGATMIYAAYVIKVLTPTEKERQDAFKIDAKANGILYDSIGNIKNVKQASSEHYEDKRYRGKYNEALGHFINLEMVVQNTSLIQKLIILLLQGTVFLTSVFFIQNGKLTIGSLVAVNAYLAMTFGPISYLARYWKWIADCFVSLELADSILQKKTEVYDAPDAIDIKIARGDVEFKNVSFEYDGKTAKDRTKVLHNVNFRIKAGETVALVGESGVGKTTIADLLSGYYFPQKGTILIDGIDTRKIKLDALRKNIGLVSQDTSIFNESVKYNIKYGSFDKSDKEVVRAAKEAGAHEFIKVYKRGYNQLVGERGVKLSGGQRQRVAIAQAILKDSRILVLDEPTSALDAKTESVVAKSLDRLMNGRTTIIIAHRLATVRKADKIVVLEKGKVVEIGKHADLIKKRNGAYRKFYELQKM